MFDVSHQGYSFDNLAPPWSTELRNLDSNIEDFHFVSFSIGKPAIDLIVKPSKTDRISHLHRNGQFKLIDVEHIQGHKLKLRITSKRHDRIMKQRPKRLHKLHKNPQLAVPYQFRQKGPKHISRSITAKNWKRTSDGKFGIQNTDISKPSNTIESTVSQDFDINIDS